MSTRGHNKKRNVGLVFEQALRVVSGHVMDSKINEAKDTLVILRKHFSSGTELKKELRIFNALLKTNVQDEKIAERILSIAKEGVRKINYKDLDYQRGKFVNEANRFFGKNQLFKIRVPRFRDYATIQVLMNEWRSDDPDPFLMADYEQKVINMMLENSESPLGSKVPEVNSLTLRLMHEKLENKYSDNLLPAQRDFLSRAVFSSNDDLMNEMNDTKNAALVMLESYLNEENSDFLKKKYLTVKENIQNYIPSCDKESFARHMTILHLLEELKSDD